MSLRKAAEMALERLESHDYWMDEEAIQALRQALAKPDEVLAERKWVGLTVDEIDKFMPYCHSDHDLSEFRTFAFEVEAKLKEKNV
jgi:hypothetical protein